MSGNGKRNFIGHVKGGKGSKGGKTKKVSSSRGLRYLISAIGRKIFNRVHRTEVEYGQTLSKKRRKNCILKSVSSLSCPVDEDGFLIHSPYRINFRFARDDTGHHLFRGSVNNFQRVNFEETCCDKCEYNLLKSDSLSRFSISSDSACDVSRSTSRSSCEYVDCEYRRKCRSTRKRKRTSQSSAPGCILRESVRTVENFIRIHSENFNGDLDAIDAIDAKQMMRDKNDEEEHSYESLVNSMEDAKIIDDSDYDILLTKSGFRVEEPFYENLKVIEAAHGHVREVIVQSSSKAPREVSQSHKTYDDVIQALKIWHMNSKNNEGDVQNMENALNHCLEGYESLENELNNDIEEVFCRT